jgi:hypothetical protein
MALGTGKEVILLDAEVRESVFWYLVQVWKVADESEIPAMLRAIDLFLDIEDVSAVDCSA